MSRISCSKLLWSHRFVPKTGSHFLARCSKSALALLAAPALLLSIYDNGENWFPVIDVQSALAAEGLRIPAPTAKIMEPKSAQIAIFSGGCFWGIEGVFEHVKGVIRVESGYAGGSRADADYGRVSSGRTGHAESVRVVYNPAKVSYNDLLHIFFSVAHDPTQLNRQGPDHGTQYRSAVFPVTSGQATAARAYIKQLSVKSPWGGAIVTKVETGTFYPAESYHQNYMANNPGDRYIVINDAPKVANLKRLFSNYYR